MATSATSIGAATVTRTMNTGKGATDVAADPAGYSTMANFAWWCWR